jgi:2-hydroxychromene-2-carboxylate isomerase
MTRAVWYFDYISPFAYLQHEVFHRLPDDLEITRKPVLFAGLLGHWGTKGPAEVPAKRVQTYRFCTWWAGRNAIAFRTPPAHPFHPLKALRLTIALESTPEVVTRIFRFIWGEGRDPNTDWPDLVAALGLSVEEADARVADSAVKDALKANTDEAIAQGVYGVPTFAVNGELFWGVDATEMLVDYLDNPALFAAGEMARLGDLPVGVQRKA